VRINGVQREPHNIVDAMDDPNGPNIYNVSTKKLCVSDVLSTKGFRFGDWFIEANLDG
jgi:hypothetical protein